MFKLLTSLFASETPAGQTPNRFRPGVDSLETRECPSSLGDDFCGNVPRWPPPRPNDAAVQTSQPAKRHPVTRG